MNYKEEFEKYWKKKGKRLAIPNKTRIYTKLRELYDEISTKYNIYDNIEEYIINHRAFEIRLVQLDFYDYLQNEKEIDLKSNSKLNSKECEKLLKRTPIERQLDLLKNTHKIFKISELEQLYNYSYKTIEKDIDNIKKGITFMGTQINPEVKDDGPRREYLDTVHPIFLALNLSEANALMKFLPKLLEKDLNETETLADRSEIKLILELIERMQIQLSDYAIKELDINIDYSHKELRFIPEKDMIKNNDELTYLMKARHTKRRITVKNITYEGYIDFPNDDQYKCIIKTINGEEIKVLKDENISIKDDYK